MSYPHQTNPSNVSDRFFGGLESWCIVFNNFAVVFFFYMKFIFVFILFMIGILTLAKFRGIYRSERLKGGEDTKDNKSGLHRPRLFLGAFYICMAFGILFNYLIYFLIFCLDPLPDRLLFDFVNFSRNIDPKAINRIEDINKAKYPHEKTIYYGVAMASFLAILDVILSIYTIVNNNGINKQTFTTLIGGVIMGILFGWTTCLPLLL